MPKTVKQLRDQLAELPDHAIVILSRDPEGNGFEDYDGWAMEKILDEEIRDEDELDEVELDRAVTAVILWPGGCRYD